MKRQRFMKSGGGEIIHIFKSQIFFYELAHERLFHVAYIPPAEVSQATYLLWKSHQHNIGYPDLFIRYCESCFFILNTFTFDNIVDNYF